MKLYISQFIDYLEIITISVFVISFLSSCFSTGMEGNPIVTFQPISTEHLDDTYASESRKEEDQSVLTPQSTSTVQINGTSVPEIENQNNQLLNYIVQELAGNERQHRFVSLVTAKNSYSPLALTHDTIQACWLYQNDVLHYCDNEEVLDSFHGEGQLTWNYSYVLFAVITGDDASTQATVRIDEWYGVGAGKGILYTLVRIEDKWQIESRKILRTS